MESIPKPEVLNPRRGKVVMVDDEPVIVGHIRDELDERGYKGGLFDDPAAVLDYVRQHKKQILLVVTDFNMPGMNGFELARQIKTEDEDIGVVLTSANVRGITQQQREELDKLGVNILEKPYKPAQILEIIEEFKRRNANLGTEVA